MRKGDIMPIATEKHRIPDDILGRLNEDPRVNAAEVKVDFLPRTGTLTLRGTVHSYEARHLAEEAALNVKGVRHVHNFLVVPLPDPTAFSDSAAPGDDGVRARINQILDAQAVLEAERIGVLVEEGKVILEGFVNAYWKKQRAGEVALGVEGVREVDNRLAVVPTRKADDEVMAASILDGLERLNTLDLQRVDVKVNNGLVTLRGTVPSVGTRWEAFQIALYTDGVADVRDELKIAIE